ncbi:hypothetical protein RM190_04740 [Paracoccus sp. CPCC 101403]|uniref:SURF1-like protein n=1 Tax=Paracoccus broussonetiae TaxID=3075834 RepID=A0ABU3EAA0_9RHOB|nr:hypothetical protein [Paracoccus sp. CPCC 101403]MDT1061155.1 hypothetical protein [Paracoccus sp. CPCC 101403]
MSKFWPLLLLTPAVIIVSLILLLNWQLNRLDRVYLPEPPAQQAKEE